MATLTNQTKAASTARHRDAEHSYVRIILGRLSGAVTFLKAVAATRNAKVFAFFWLLTFVACYLRFRLFGLYEDDLNQARFWAYSPGEMLDYIIGLFETGGGGRPVGLTILRTGFMAGFHIGGLDALYMMGMMVFVTNAFLTYKVTETIAPPVIALAAGMMFVMFPADALKITIVRGFAVQPALTFGLAGILFYVHRRYIAAYACAILALATYEFGLLPFLLAPFFVLENFRAKLIRLATHAAVTGGILGTIVFLRLTSQATGHLSELTGLSWGERFERLFTALYLGPWTSLKAYWIMPKTFFDNIEAWHFIVVFGVAAMSYFGLRLMEKAPDLAPAKAGPAASRAPLLDRLFSEKNVTLLLLVGLAAWVIAYAMAVSDSRYPPVKQFGRTTSVHTAATIGASMTFAAIVWALSQLAKRFRVEPKYAVWPLVAAYLAVLGGFQALVQSKVIESWAVQKLIWTQIVEQVDDWQDGTVIVLGYNRPPNTKYVYTMSWASTVMARNMFDFPEDWTDDPTVLFVPQLNGSYGEVTDGDFYVKRRPWEQLEKVDPEKIIYFTATNRNVLKRSFGKFSYKGYSVNLAPKGPTQKFKTKPLYDVLVLPPGTLDGEAKK